MKIFGVIGHPIAHSMSPAMHNNEFDKLGLKNHYYAAFDVHPDHLKSAMEGVRALNIQGLNVTIPHKVSVMEWLDDIDEEAQLIGAINTIKNENGKLIGTNTDGQGYLRSLLSLMTNSLKEKNILIIGAGGASMAIVTSIARHGVAKMTITNRTLSKAVELVNHVGPFVPAEALQLNVAEDRLSEYDVIINTTSVGMTPNIGERPLSLQKLRPGTVVSDLIYNPLETLFLREAKAKGAITDNGLAMFIYQGALSFEHWTGVMPNIERMKQIVLKKLGEDNNVNG